MKAISIVLASVLCAGAPAVAQEENREPKVVQTQENSFQLGSNVIPQLRADFEAGKYDEFLSEMDGAYKKANDAQELEGLIEIRKESANFSFPQEKLINGFDKIQREKNSQLLKLASESKDSLFVEKIRSAATPLSPSVQDALSTLASIRNKAPGAGASSDENKLIEIDLENHYKRIHLDSLVAMGQSVPDRKEKHMILEMQRMSQMAQAAAEFQDQDLKKAVEIASVNHDAVLVRNYDMSDLNALARGKIKPQSSVEEKAASIVADSHEKFSDLNRNLLETAQK